MAVVTISHGSKTGGLELAQRVAERLAHRCISSELLSESARRYNIELETLEAQMSAPGLLQRLSRERHRYLIFIRCSLLQAARDGGIVYHGSAGQVFLAGIRHVLRVRVIAPLEQRARALAEELGVDDLEATAQIRRSDDERRRWASFLYERDAEDPELCDLVLNLGSLDVATAADLVVAAAEHPAFRPTPASLQQLEDMSLQCEVQAALAAVDDLCRQPIEVTARAGEVVLGGGVESERHIRLAQELVPLVKGVRSVVNGLSVRSQELAAGVPWRD